MTNLKRAITADDFTKLAVYSDPQFSPDGKKYAFVSTTVNQEQEYESHLYVQDINNSVAKQWTFGNHLDSHPRFSPDGSAIVFQSNRSGVSQLWLLPTNGGEAKQLTTLKYGATNPIWSKDGKFIVFSASLEENDSIHNQTELTLEERKKLTVEKEKQPLIVKTLKYKSDAKGFHDGKKTHIILYDLINNAFQQLTTNHVNHTVHDISKDGNQILFTANYDENADYQQKQSLFILNRTSNQINRATEIEGAFQNARFSHDDKKIIAYFHDYSFASATLSDLVSINIETGKLMKISTNWDIQLGDALIGDTRLGTSYSGPILSSDNDTIYFLATNHGATNLYKTTVENQELELIYGNNNQVFGFDFNDKTKQIILGISEPTNPCNFYLWKEASNLTKLTDANRDWLNEVELSKPETITITANDGWEIQGWLMKPYGFSENKNYPFVLEIHGGPHAMYGQSYFHEMQVLAAKGYVVLFTNPRGSHGYGQKFVDAVRGDYGGSDYTDLMTAVDFALEQYDFIDSNRLGVTGGSYGGFMTNWIVGHTNRFKAAVTQRSISNWLSFYGVSDIGHYFTEWELGIPYLKHPEKLWDFSPLKYVENVETPLLILHGELDFRCPIEQGEQLFIALKHLRKDVEFIRFPNANHELSRSGDPSLRIERLTHICRWFDQYL